ELEMPAEEASLAEFIEGKGSILLVEDEITLRETNAEFLASIGYSVLCAGSGPEALTIAEEAGNIDLVISDVVMPRMSGREFVTRLREVRPETKLLFISGYADDVVLQNGISMNGTPFLQKPYSLHQLGRKVSELLAHRKSSAA
ncbi:MAG TPA: response regulator, partial [Terriglobales bacterium]|nr:response regulator [Terriglobales bacterium]